MHKLYTATPQRPRRSVFKARPVQVCGCCCSYCQPAPTIRVSHTPAGPLHGQNVVTHCRHWRAPALCRVVRVCVWHAAHTVFDNLSTNLHNHLIRLTALVREACDAEPPRTFRRQGKEVFVGLASVQALHTVFDVQVGHPYTPILNTQPTPYNPIRNPTHTLATGQPGLDVSRVFRPLAARS